MYTPARTRVRLIHVVPYIYAARYKYPFLSEEQDILEVSSGNPRLVFVQTPDTGTGETPPRREWDRLGS